MLQIENKLILARFAKIFLFYILYINKNTLQTI